MVFLRRTLGNNSPIWFYACRIELFEYPWGKLCSNKRPADWWLCFSRPKRVQLQLTSSIHQTQTSVYASIEFDDSYDGLIEGWFISDWDDDYAERFDMGGNSSPATEAAFVESVTGESLTLIDTFQSGSDFVVDSMAYFTAKFGQSLAIFRNLSSDIVSFEWTSYSGAKRMPRISQSMRRTQPCIRNECGTDPGIASPDVAGHRRSGTYPPASRIGRSDLKQCERRVSSGTRRFLLGPVLRQKNFT